MKPIIIANWKQYLKPAAAVKLFGELCAAEKKGALSGVTVIVAAPLLALPEIAAVAKKAKSKIKIAAQDCGMTDVGAHTGAVSPKDLKALGVSYVIVGHSERRAEYGETDEVIAKKISAARAAKLVPIVCVGETASERAAKKTHAVVAAQVESAMSVMQKPAQVIFAYEPRWAIGTGTPVAAADADAVHALIQKVAGAEVAVCYGGSVLAENIAGFMAEPHVAGALIGGASQKRETLLACIKNAI